MQLVHPPPNYVLANDEQRSLDLVLRVNCLEASPARMLQVFSATGNGTAGGLVWQMQVDGDGEEMLQVSWQLLPNDSTLLNSYEHWHCSGWRQWQLVVHRESGAREQALMRVRSPLLLDALEHVQEAALRRGVPPTFVQVGAMDGVVSFLRASSVAYRICWCTEHADCMFVYGMFLYLVYGNAEGTGHLAPGTWARHHAQLVRSNHAQLVRSTTLAVCSALVWQETTEQEAVRAVAGT
jgi:hypothetical protein